MRLRWLESTVVLFCLPVRDFFVGCTSRFIELIWLCIKCILKCLRKKLNQSWARWTVWCLTQYQFQQSRMTRSYTKHKVFSCFKTLSVQKWKFPRDKKNTVQLNIFLIKNNFFIKIFQQLVVVDCLLVVVQASVLVDPLVGDPWEVVA